MNPRVLLAGKQGSITHWLENAAEGFQKAGAEVRQHAINRPGMVKRLLRKLGAISRTTYEQCQAQHLIDEISHFRPHLVLFIHPYNWSSEVIKVAASHPGKPVLAGWVGDRFEPACRVQAQALHKVYYTDSGLLAEARAWHFPPSDGLLPLAVNPDNYPSNAAPSVQRMVFVGTPTPLRCQTLRDIRPEVSLYGSGWNIGNASAHIIHAHRVPYAKVPGIYAQHLAVLNIRNEMNVLSALNQRVFEAAAGARPVVNDWVADLEHSFEPDREVLTYRETSELNEHYSRLLADPGLAIKIGQAARQRVLADHTFRQRAEFILRDLGLTS